MGMPFEWLLKVAGIVSIPGLIIALYGSKKMLKDTKDDIWFVRAGKILFVALGIAVVWLILAILKYYNFI